MAKLFTPSVIYKNIAFWFSSNSNVPTIESMAFEINERLSKYI